MAINWAKIKAREILFEGCLSLRILENELKNRNLNYSKLIEYGFTNKVTCDKIHNNAIILKEWLEK